MSSAADFASTYGPKGVTAWEAAALALAKAGDFAAWPLKTITISAGGRSLALDVATDYFALGTVGAPLRLPLTPVTAQRIADALGMLLPTPALVKAVHDQADAKVLSTPVVPNNGASMSQYVQHSTACDQALGGAVGDPSKLRSGLKKDVTVGNIWKPGKVLIYGWVKPAAAAGRDPTPMLYVDWRVQPYSNVHGDFYVDYSHGARLIDRACVLDGAKADLLDLYASKDPSVSALVSWEGALRQPRYPTPEAPAVAKGYRSLLTPTTPSLADRGRQVAIDDYERIKREGG